MDSASWVRGSVINIVEKTELKLKPEPFPSSFISSMTSLSKTLFFFFLSKTLYLSGPHL